MHQINKTLLQAKKLRESEEGEMIKAQGVREQLGKTFE